MKSFLTGVLILFSSSVLIAMDAVLHTHVFFTGFLLAAALFFSRERLVYLYILGGWLQDVRFQFPFGVSYLFLALFLAFFPILLKIVHSRMVALGFYLIVCALFFEILDMRTQIEPSDIVKTLVFSLFVVIGVYLVSLRFIRQQSVHIKTSLLKFS